MGNPMVVHGIVRVTLDIVVNARQNMDMFAGKRMEWGFLQIHSITLSAGLQRHVRATGKASIDIFKDGEFAEFRACLDAEMKRLQRNGLGSRTKKAEPLSEEEEETLWSKGILGKHSPQALVYTLLFMSGLYFALRSGQEHRQLRAEPCQIILHERPGERLIWNTQRWSQRRKLKTNIVQHHSNPTNSDRCFVEVFKLYRSF